MFRNLMMSALTLAALAGLPTAASAATPQDVRCFMLSNVYAQKNDKEEGRRLAQMSSFFYLGKIQGMSDAELRRQIAEQRKLINPATASAEMQACARAVQASGLRLQSFSPAAQAPQRK